MSSYRCLSSRAVNPTRPPKAAPMNPEMTMSTGQKWVTITWESPRTLQKEATV